MAKKGESKKGAKPQGARKAVTSDPRFARVHNDPRFNMPKRRDMKVTIDERFKNKMASEEDFKRKTVVDKYGRKVAKDSSEKELKKYYNMDEDEEKKHSEEDESESGSEADSESSDSEAEENSKAKKIAPKPIKKSPEIASASDSDSESESESDSSEDDAVTGYNRARGEDSDVSESSDDDSSEDEALEEELLIETEEVAQGDETKSIAVVNLDWDNVRAVDLMATFSSFVPTRGRIESVTIYPSEYGKMRMAQEDLQGPAPELFTSKKKKNDSDDEELTTKDLIEEDKGEDVDSKTLRKYQLQRLRYYYAVVKCDTIATARNIYDNCDGTEFEATANFFDLRYVPDDMEFDDEPHDKCTLVPADYKPNYFVTDALQHSKVRLTWDETPAERIKLASKAFSRREIDDMDFQAYLASDSDGSGSDDKEDMKSKYKSLLSNSEYGSYLEGDVKNDVDMEITFTPGLDGEKLPSDSESEKEETTLEKYKRKEKERRKQRMESWKSKNEEEAEDKTKTKNKKNKKAAPTAEEAKEAAELELLMMDDDESAKVKHFDMKEILKAEKKAKRNKGKKKSDEPEVSGMDFEVDVKDDRFEQLYESHEFAIDPNQPHFKKSAGMEKLLEERRKRTLNKPSKEAAVSAPKSKYASEVFSAAQKRKHDGDSSIQDLIAKVKRRTKK